MILHLVRAKRRVAHLVERWLEKRRLAPLYDPDPNDLDRARHLDQALAWLKRAQDSGTDRGVAYGTEFGREFDVSYPETTGYICQTFVKLATEGNDDELLRRAVEMGSWEAAIQLPDGAVMGGKFNSEPTPAVFNTGMVLLGWAALMRSTGDRRFEAAARKAADWMVSIQEDDGHWIRGHSRFAPPGSTLYNVKAAWGLAEAGLALGDDRYLHAAVRNAEYCLSLQQENGWFPRACFSDPRNPLLHTQAYCMQGLWGVGNATGRQDLKDGAIRFADAQIEIMGPDGHLPGRQDSSFEPASSWCCVTGSAQVGVVWGEIFRQTGERKYLEGLRRVNRYLMARHDIRNPDERLRGGATGSWPVWGEYGRLSVLSWATKFLVDSLWMDLRLSESTPSGKL